MLNSSLESFIVNNTGKFVAVTHPELASQPMRSTIGGVVMPKCARASMAQPIASRMSRRPYMEVGST